MIHPARTLLSAVAAAAFIVGCGSKESPPPADAADTDTDTDADTDADSDTDTDADSDSDTDSDSDADTDPAGPTRTTTTVGAGVALSADGALAIVANRSAGEISVLDLDLAGSPATGSARVTYNEGDGEPWAAVLDGDESHAFVVLRHAKEVVRIDDPRGAAVLHPTRASTDSEPSSIAITPNGSAVYVANWGAGTVTVVDPSTMDTHEIDLNASLLATGAVGASVSARPALARPYAIAITNDGDADDSDETVYVTEFFGQDQVGVAFTDDSFFDTAKQGLVYSFGVDDELPATPISLGASADMGFVDSNGVTAGCYPNQLTAAAIDGSTLYVAGLCASPRGPAAPGSVDKVANFKTKVETVLYSVDLGTGTEDVSERLLLNRVWTDEYDANGVPDDGSRRFPLLVHSMAFVPGTHILYFPAYGADGMFRLEFDGSGGVAQVGSSINDFVNLAGPLVGKLPYGIAVTDAGNAVIVNENTRNLSIVDLAAQSVEAVVPSASPVDPLDLAAVDANDGRRLFVTGTGRWSYNGQAWNSCEACHPFGLTDNVTWFFATGPRQTVSLDGTYDADGQQRVLNWSGIFDELSDFEGNTRGISGGVGAIVADNTGAVVNDDRIVFDGTALTGLQIGTDALQAGLNGSTVDLITSGVPGHTVANVPVTAKSVLTDWSKIDAYTKAIRSPRAPNLDPAAVDRGAQIFADNGCQGCHGGPAWTISQRFYTPSQATNDAVTGTLGIDTYSRGNLPIGLNPPADAGGGTAVLRAGGSINCVLRSVGTFPDAGTDGVVPAGVVVSERKEDMGTTAAGASGFNPPALVGGAAGAPYFHAGNARSLEEVFDPTFSDHYRAFSANFTPAGADLADLVTFLLSLDDDAATLETSFGAFDTVLCE